MVREGDLAFVGDRAKWSVVVALLCGCEFITGALDPVGETDTDMAVEDALSDSGGPSQGSGTSGTSTIPPQPSTTDEGESADEGGVSSGGERDPSWGTTSGSGVTGDNWETTSGTSAGPDTYDGSCCEAGLGTTCEDPGIAECVCAIDPWCCEQEWDGVCVDLVEQGGCGSCQVGKTEASALCCDPHDGPGCEMNDVAVCVCKTDPYCCNVAWDGTCAAEVEQLGCGQCADGTTTDIGPFGATEGDTDLTGPASSGSTGG